MSDHVSNELHMPPYALNKKRRTREKKKKKQKPTQNAQHMVATGASTTTKKGQKEKEKRGGLFFSKKRWAKYRNKGRAGTVKESTRTRDSGLDRDSGGRVWRGLDMPRRAGCTGDW